MTLILVVYLWISSPNHKCPNYKDLCIKQNKMVLVKCLDLVDKTDIKYILLVRLLNKILAYLKRELIKDIDEFPKINESIIIKIPNINNLMGMSDEIFKYYDKKEMNWYRRNQVKCYFISFLAKACELFGCSYGLGYDDNLRKHDLCVIQSYNIEKN